MQCSGKLLVSMKKSKSARSRDTSSGKNPYIDYTRNKSYAVQSVQSEYSAKLSMDSENLVYFVLYML